MRGRSRPGAGARSAAAVLLATVASLAPVAAAQGDSELPAILARDPAGLPRAQAGRWDGAFDPERAPDVLGKLPPDVLQLASLGERAYFSRDYVAALEHLFAALEREPDLPHSLLLLGTTYYRLRRYGDGIGAFERFREVLPDQAWRLQALGHCYYGLGRYDEAAATYLVVLARMEDSPEAIRGLGLCHLRRGDPGAALARLLEVVALRPEHADAWTWIARVHLDEGRAAQARDAAQRARALDPYQPRPHFLLALAHFEEGAEEEAQAARARFEELDRIAQDVRAVEGRLLLAPRDPALLGELWSLHHGAGDVERAADAALGWIGAQPPDADPAVRMAVAGLPLDPATLEALERRAGDSAALWELLAALWSQLGDEGRAGLAAARARSGGH